jgi:YVTN family beta-propeller protein
VTRVDTLEHRDPSVRPQARVELPVADVERDHARGAPLQEAVGEPSGRGAEVEAVLSGRIDPQLVERPRELLAAARDEARRAHDGQVDVVCDLLARLVVTGDQAGHDERLRLLPALGQSALNEENVEPLAHGASVNACDHAAEMEFRILGPLEVEREGRVLSLGTGRQLALVAALLLHRNEVVSVDRLVDELWDGEPPPTAAKIVRNNVSLLRKELGDRLVTRPPGYVLHVEAGELDADRLEEAVERGGRDELDAALALWRGPPLLEVAYERFAESEIARLEELRLVAIESRIEADLERGRHAALVPELESLVQQHPLRERLQGQLMLALYRSGRQGEALESYRRARRALDEELGIEPGPALRELERLILNQDASLGAPSIPVARLPRRPRSRTLAIAVLTAVVVAAAAAVAVIARGHDSGGGLTVPPNYVGVIDAETGNVTSAIPVGIRPGPVAAGGSSVWVGNLDDRNLTRIDPRRREAIATVSLNGRTPTGVAVGAGAVWVAHGRGGELSRVEPRFGQSTTIAVTSRPYAAPLGSVALGAGGVWAVYGDSTLARIRRDASRVIGSTLTGASSSSVVVGDGSLWVANAGDATVQRFNPATFTEGPVRVITVGRVPVALAYGHDALWVVNRADDTVTRIDPSTNASVFTIRVGDGPVAVAVGPEGVWVANAGDGTVSRIDPATNATTPIEVGNSPAGVAVIDGLVWVTVRGA